MTETRQKLNYEGMGAVVTLLLFASILKLAFFSQSQNFFWSSIRTFSFDVYLERSRKLLLTLGSISAYSMIAWNAAQSFFYGTKHKVSASIWSVIFILLHPVHRCILDGTNVDPMTLTVLVSASLVHHTSYRYLAFAIFFALSIYQFVFLQFEGVLPVTSHAFLLLSCIGLKKDKSVTDRQHWQYLQYFCAGLLVVFVALSVRSGQLELLQLQLNRSFSNLIEIVYPVSIKVSSRKGIEMSRGLTNKVDMHIATFIQRESSRWSPPASPAQFLVQLSLTALLLASLVSFFWSVASPIVSKQRQTLQTQKHFTAFETALLSYLLLKLHALSPLSDAPSSFGDCSFAVIILVSSKPRGHCC